MKYLEDVAKKIRVDTIGYSAVQYLKQQLIAISYSEYFTDGVLAAHYTFIAYSEIFEKFASIEREELSQGECNTNTQAQTEIEDSNQISLVLVVSPESDWQSLREKPGGANYFERFCGPVKKTCSWLVTNLQ